MIEHGLFYRDTWVEVDLDCITANVAAVRKRLPAEVTIIGVVKANAYGHGDYQTAMAALNAGASMLAVAFMDEALSLRVKGINAPILVLGASRPEDVTIAAKNNIILTVFQREWIEKAQSFLAANANLSLHIKVDTGMGRIGVRNIEELREIEEAINKDSRLVFAGVFTHFATADELDNHYFLDQLERFDEMVSSLSSRPPCVHGSNSAAALRYGKANFNAIRLGIVMYGLSPSQEIKADLPIKLEEAFSLHSKLTQVKLIKRGEKISYGGTYEAEQDEWVGTIPIGYADGWIRRLQDQEVLIDGIRSPIIGRICMDQTIVRLPHQVEVGTVVTLIGKQGDAAVPIDEIADKLDTINYEIPCLISSRVPRLYKKGGEIIDLNNALLPKNN
ncbi:alanine racemase [Mesobacillus persicus]|uniref:Alanine racemase n=1 Tax=Mesobacillus persicus TaxID=930146 RepID=A0A1H8KCM0_9BACI|nr:alanine racemase [Mesobacillus persicus]SEN90487.1 alanine racemase [Mesobacillus persicus]